MANRAVWSFNLRRNQPTSGWALHVAKGWLVAGRVMDAA